MRRKMTDSRGESLVELLASILIATMSVILLFTGIAAATHINKMSQAADKAHYEDLIKAERQSASDQIGSGAVKLGVGGNEIVIDIDIYGSAETDGLRSFAVR